MICGAEDRVDQNLTPKRIDREPCAESAPKKLSCCTKRSAERTATRQGEGQSREVRTTGLYVKSITVMENVHTIVHNIINNAAKSREHEVSMGLRKEH